MSKFLHVRTQSIAIAVCQRCRTKIYQADLQKDPNNGLLVCRDCVDIYDPWRLPARHADDITLQNPRPDERITADISYVIGTESGIPINFPPEVSTQ